MDIIQYLKQFNIEVSDPSLVRQACMHSSYANEHKAVHDNERLEFMGDAVLQLWTSEHIFPLNLKEGDMTTLRAQLVCETALANYARALHLNDYLLLGSGEEKQGGREKNAIIADMFEALLGALYLNNGMDAVDIILNKCITPQLSHPNEINTISDYKTKLQEYVQSDTRKTVYYEVVSTTGPSNAPVFEVVVKMDDITLGRGKGNSKKKAEQAAAKDAFNKMVK